MTIQLGILVVYMVSEPQAKLLDLHLGRIARHTSVPYRIYGCHPRLPPRFIQTLSRRSEVTLYDLPPTPLRGAPEHSYYLEQLLRLAIDDGASHLLTLHVDSFPVRDGWIEALVGRLSGACAFVTVENISTACLLFHRDFFLTYRPSLLVSAEDRKSAEYRAYLRAVQPELHSGTGFGLTAYRAGLGWSYMRKSSLVETTPHCPALFDDLVFHLDGAVRLSMAPSGRIPWLLESIGYRRLESFVAPLRALAPPAVKDLLRSSLRRPLASVFDEPRTQWKARAMTAACEQLLADPDGYIERLRGRASETPRPEGSDTRRTASGGVRRPDSIRCAFIVASNDEQVLRSCLLASPDLAAGVETSVQRGFTSAGEAYNRGIAATDGDILVFVHQDVYLPEGWLRKLASVIEWLEARDPNWGVLGVFGSERDRTGRGYLYSTGLRRVLGEDFVGARPVETLDEVVLILRRASGLRFDASLPGFHLYGADICLQAAARGMRSYAMSAFCIHNTNGYRLLPWAYWRCYLRLRRKWWSRLPAQTPCMPMTRWGGPALRYLVRRPVWLLWHGRRIGHRVAHPALVFREVHRAPGGSLALVDERRIR